MTEMIDFSQIIIELIIYLGDLIIQSMDIIHILINTIFMIENHIIINKIINYLNLNK